MLFHKNFNIKFDLYGTSLFRLLDLNYKTLENRNLRQMGRFRSKLESFITSTLAFTNTRAYNETCTIGICNVVIVQAPS
jgi:hypothetical protein